MGEGAGPWLALAGLGAFHGANPAMGWLFAVALGLHRGSRRAVLGALPPIALGHALSVAAVLALVLGAGLVVPAGAIERAAGLALLGWAALHLRFGHRVAGRVRVGMRAGAFGLALWSFAMASAHGAGLMLVPVVLPLCLAAAPGAALTASGSAPTAFLALLVHTGALLAVTGGVALLVHGWFGLAFLRRGWLNLDRVWAAALAAVGVLLLL